MKTNVYFLMNVQGFKNYIGKFPKEVSHVTNEYFRSYTFKTLISNLQNPRLASS